MIQEYDLNFHTDDTDLVMFTDDGNTENLPQERWKVLIVDDEAGIHHITKTALRDFTYDGKYLSFLSVYSEEDAKKLIGENKDIALIFLDMIEETEQAGREFVGYIRKILKNPATQIIARSNCPDKVPEDLITFNCDINDYTTKTELITEKLVSVVFTALRTYKREIKLQNQAKINIMDGGHSWGQTLSNTAINSLILQFQGSITPALPENIKENKLYQEALNAYLEQDFLVAEAQKNAQEVFSRCLLAILGEWQVTVNQEKLIKAQQQWEKDNWFSKLDQYQTEKILQQKRNRLLILSAIPEISVDCPQSFHDHIQTEISTGIGNFLESYYPLHSPLCPVEYHGDYFRESISYLDFKKLQEILNSIATVIIYSEITKYQVNINIGFWTMQGGSVTQFSLPTWDWDSAYHNLREQGQSEVEALRNIRTIIVTTHQLLAGFIADWYYLNLNLLYEPQLFKLHPAFPSQWTRFYLETLQNTYNWNLGEVCYRRGVKLAQLENYSTSLENFNKAIQLRPRGQKIFAERGQVLIKLKQWQQAKDCFDEALKLKARDALALKGKGIALFNLLQFEEAVNCFDQALAIKPDDYEIWTLRGNTLYNLGQLEKAIESYENALAIKPKYQEAVNYRQSATNNLGHNLGHNKKTFILDRGPIENTNTIEKTKEINLDSSQVWLEQGQIKFHEQKWQEALNCFTQALKLDPDNYQTLKWRAFTLFNLKEWKRAIANFNKALAIKATNHRIWSYRGLAFYSLGRFAEAIESYERALIINPKYAKARKYRDSAIEKLGLKELKSDCNINYTRLRDLLAQGNWKEADRETSQLMLQAAAQGRKELMRLEFEDIEKFPLNDLRTIDTLWRFYSEGQFGFSVQKAIYESLGNYDQIYDEKRWTTFAHQIGWIGNSRWLSYQELNFSKKAPKGHLPTGPKLPQSKMMVFLFLKLESHV